MFQFTTDAAAVSLETIPTIVYQCFLVALFSEVAFLARESCVIRNASASRCLLPFEASEQLLQLLLQIILQSINSFVDDFGDQRSG